MAHFRAHVALRGALAQLSAAHTFVARVAHVWRTCGERCGEVGAVACACHALWCLVMAAAKHPAMVATSAEHRGNQALELACGSRN